MNSGNADKSRSTSVQHQVKSWPMFIRRALMNIFGPQFFKICLGGFTSFLTKCYNEARLNCTVCHKFLGHLVHHCHIEWYLLQSALILLKLSQERAHSFLSRHKESNYMCADAMNVWYVVQSHLAKTTLCTMLREPNCALHETTERYHYKK